METKAIIKDYGIEPMTYTQVDGVTPTVVRNDSHTESMPKITYNDLKWCVDNGISVKIIPSDISNEVTVRLSKGDYVEARMFSLDHYDARHDPDEAISITIEKMINDLQK